MDILNWFKNLDTVVQGAIISGVVTIIVAVITGVFGLVKKGNDANHKTIIKQKQERDSGASLCFFHIHQHIDNGIHQTPGEVS